MECLRECDRVIAERLVVLVFCECFFFTSLFLLASFLFTQSRHYSLVEAVVSIRSGTSLSRLSPHSSDSEVTEPEVTDDEEWIPTRTFSGKKFLHLHFLHHCL